MQIDSGLPIPKRRGSKKSKYPWKDMKVGDSFLMEVKTSASGASLANRAGKIYGMKFACRKTDEGVRVWRTG